ncbi:FimV/HubP family polar landmark protein [Pseudoalteromonas fenneropenaei]|uniref:FimV/HubP family polar landmark protein n=1 Tax=Pseudoalteromonas fenneropenaei TaxID=1737459 RepID=A0ABV7CN69_9GAMM
MRGLALFCILASALLVTPGHAQEGTPLKGPKGVDYGMQGRAVGPIKPTDTLWRIAAKVRPDESVTIYQVMVALYEKNPDSFLDQNLNHMRSGAYLQIPSMGEIRQINPNLARQRSEQDDELWEMKKNGMLDNATIEQAKKKVTQARKVDVEEAKQELESAIKDIRIEQDARLVELQNQFKNSVKSVEEILEENGKLKKHLGSISKELETVRKQLGEDSEIQKQLKEVIDLQNELIAQQEAKKKQGTELGLDLTSPLAIALLATIPGLLAITGLVLFLRKRKAKNAVADDDDEFLPQSPRKADPDPLDLGPAAAGAASVGAVAGAAMAASAEPSVQLDDDMLPDDDIMFDDLDEDAFEEGSNTLNQDELNSLLGDDISFDDDADIDTSTDILGDDGDLDDFLQQNFDEEHENEIDLDLDAGPDNSGDILSADDIDDLFNELAAEDDALDIGDDNTLDVSDDALAALSEELATDVHNDVDIDAILDDAADDEGEFDLDNIDSLLDEVAATKESVDEGNAIATELEDEADIDALLDGVQDESELTPTNLDDDNFDLEDIDALLNSAADEQHAEVTDEALAALREDALPELIEEDDSLDDLDLDDLDSLLEPESEELTAEDEALQQEVAVADDKALPELIEEDDSLDESLDELDLDDLDSLLEPESDELIAEDEAPQQDAALTEADEEALPKLVEEDDSLDESLDELDLDDLDSLLEPESEELKAEDEAPQQEAALTEADDEALPELVEEDDSLDDLDLDDLDSLLEPESDELIAEDEAPQQEAALTEADDEALPELVEEDDSLDDLDLDDLDSLLEPESDELTAEDEAPQLEAALTEADDEALPELIEEDDSLDDLDLDDLDSLLEPESEELTAEDEAPQQEAALTEADEEALPELVEEDDALDDLDLDDLDSLLEPESEELKAKDEAPQQEAALTEADDEALPELLEEDDSLDDLDLEDLDSLLEPDTDELDNDEDISALLEAAEDELSNTDELSPVLSEDSELNDDDEALISEIDALLSGEELSKDEFGSEELGGDEDEDETREALGFDPLAEGEDQDLVDGSELLAELDALQQTASVPDTSSDASSEGLPSEKSSEEQLSEELNAQEFDEHFVDSSEPEEEFDSAGLKSVEELLNELQQQEEELPVAPAWDDPLDADVAEQEIDLGDDPLVEDIDLLQEEERIEDAVTPSKELDDYPELELAAEESFNLDDLDERVADDTTLPEEPTLGELVDVDEGEEPTLDLHEFDLDNETPAALETSAEALEDDLLADLDSDEFADEVLLAEEETDTEEEAPVAEPKSEDDEFAIADSQLEETSAEALEDDLLAALDSDEFADEVLLAEEDTDTEEEAPVAESESEDDEFAIADSQLEETSAEALEDDLLAALDSDEFSDDALIMDEDDLAEAEFALEDDFADELSEVEGAAPASEPAEKVSKSPEDFLADLDAALEQDGAEFEWEADDATQEEEHEDTPDSTATAHNGTDAPVTEPAATEPAKQPDVALDINEAAIDEEFMADFSQTDFDALLNELAEPEVVLDADADEFAVDFDALLADEDLPSKAELASNTPEIASEAFLDIESLLEQSDEAELDHEPYDAVNMDVGLGDFEEFLAGDNPVDVDAEDGGFSAKLDLARAYLEIGDLEAAMESLQAVINDGPQHIQAEAQTLMEQIKPS